MNKPVFVLLLCIALFTWPHAQKPPVAAGAFGSWPTLTDVQISNDGRFYSYELHYQDDNKPRSYIQALNGSWKRSPDFPSPEIRFSSDSKYVIYNQSSDSLAIYSPLTDSVFFLTGVAGGSQIINNPNGDWIVGLSATSHYFFWQRLCNKNGDTISDAVSFKIIPDKKSVIIGCQSIRGKDTSYPVKWLDLTSGKSELICTEKENSGFIASPNGLMVAYLKSGLDGSKPTGWLYCKGTGKPVLFFDNSLYGIDSSYSLEDITGISDNGEEVFVMLQKKQTALPSTYNVPVNIWSYADEKLQSQQLKELHRIHLLQGAVLWQKHVLIPLSRPGNDWPLRNGDVALATKTRGDYSQWNKFSIDSLFAISSERPEGDFIGYSTDVPMQSTIIGKKFIIYFDKRSHNFYSYENATGIKRNLTQGIHTVWEQLNCDAFSLSSFHPYETVLRPAAWVGTETRVLVNDRYDIWLLDPLMINQPVCLTKGYGAAHHIVFRILGEEGKETPQQLELQGNVVISAFDNSSKENGFYNIDLQGKIAPSLLSMGPYIYYAPQMKESGPPQYGMIPIKAESSHGYLVTRQSASEFPNLFYTQDFKVFRQLTYLDSEHHYNWIQTELVTWTTTDGIKTQGILYKPDNFNPKKKYPVIVHIYQLLSDNLNSFIYPDWSKDRMNIPYYVSNGYMVFEPDIYYLGGRAYESALNAVVSGVQRLSNFSFVDKGRIGLMGHSWGAAQANYIVTHCNLFKAVCSASGISDLVAYNGTTHLYFPLSYDTENSQSRAPGSIWQNKQWYLDNSAILYADKITTPLLLMHTTNDPICPLPQAVEFFTALRRLGKKAWMLEYEGEQHSILNPASYKDYTIRMKQFFDYYLMDAHAPKWMVEGISASKKGYEDGLELEPADIHPGPGILKTAN